jgi:hypothetical protein
LQKTVLDHALLKVEERPLREEAIFGAHAVENHLPTRFCCIASSKIRSLSSLRKTNTRRFWKLVRGEA